MNQSVLTTEDVETAIKILIVGNGSVGKSSLIRRFCRGQFTENYKKTIGVDYMERDITVPGHHGDVKLMVWDTAGQEEFDSITKAYYKDANALVLAFSTTDRQSFETIKSWRSKVEQVCDDLSMVLIQNKIDLIGSAAVTNEEAESLARELKLKFYRISVKDSLNVEETFQYIAELHLKRLKERAKNAVGPIKPPTLETVMARKTNTFLDPVPPSSPARSPSPSTTVPGAPAASAASAAPVAHSAGGLATSAQEKSPSRTSFPGSERPQSARGGKTGTAKKDCIVS
ncbi:ras family-domain-containing protein [Polychytrium aggregatum]|uniref:ras family-domain-containing protein n=1 Tax=Polychytrium aggregatum TaxID=110093 RepID=UPI0022FDB7A2|nr:ras family-domain-containing protein [Polychytrium aggregatum]KAI9202958.1 ras family-domain-containing protein [Polychytrium aggregatum]